MFAATSHSLEMDASKACAELFTDLEAQLKGRKAQAGILLTGIDVAHQEINSAIKQKWPQLELIGCSGYGEFSSQRSLADDSISLTLLGSDTIRIRAGLGRNITENMQDACEQACKVSEDEDQALSLCLCLTESHSCSGDLIINTLQNNLGEGLPIIGGMAADDFVRNQTFQYYKGEVLSDAIVTLLFSGPLIFSFGKASGWKATSKPGLVTHSDGNIVYEIDHKPAIDFYTFCAGTFMRPNGEIPLAVLKHDGTTDYLRAPHEGFDEDTGAITFYADIPEGSTVKMATQTRKDIIQASKDSIQQACQNFPEGRQATFIFCISCCARRLMLGQRSHEEIDLLIDNALCSAPVIGFYSFGEYAPQSLGEPSRFHNETFVTLIMGESGGINE